MTRSEWSELMDRFEDANLYQTWPYGVVRYGEHNLSHLVLRCGREAVAAAQVRIVRPWNLKWGIAYIRFGPVCHPRGRDLDPNVAVRMAVALRDEYARRRGLYLRILPNAYVGTARADVLQSAFSEYRVEPFDARATYRTLVLDLAPALDVLRKNLDQKWRNQLNRAEKNGLEVMEGDGGEEFRVFFEIYDEMLARKKFQETQDVRDFVRIQERLPENHRLHILICKSGGTPVSGMVGAALGNSAFYVLGATNDRGLNAKGAYLLQWRMIQWLKQKRIRYYDLGGINPERNPGVYHFKKGLSGRDMLYMNSMVCCRNFLSTALARGGEKLQGGFRNYLTTLLRGKRV